MLSLLNATNLASCARLLAVIALFYSCLADAKGQGPIGLWAASNRYVLVADKHLTGLVLVDLIMGKAVERLPIEGPVKGVASCPKCDFALISGEGGNFWLAHFDGPVIELLEQKKKIGFDTTRLEPLELTDNGVRLSDGRMVRISENGELAFIASSNDRAVFRLDLASAPHVQAIIKDDKAKPFGLNWTQKGELLVAMHKKEVWRITTEGHVLAKYSIKAADCPGVKSLKPNLRAAIDDPVNSNSLLILASNPKSYDAVIWRLSVNSQGEHTCSIAAGKIGRDSGWVDGSGESIVFSRPHFFVLRPDSDPPQLIISDIDNQALRLLNLNTDSSTTVMYNRDRRVQVLPASTWMSSSSCERQNWETAKPATNPLGAASCARPAHISARALTLPEAQAHCAAEGARLCEPAELRQTGVAERMTAWTNAECASCWHRKANDQCSEKIATHKTKDLTHGSPEFSQSWNSGRAIEIPGVFKDQNASYCSPVINDLRLSTPCCADVF